MVRRIPLFLRNSGKCIFLALCYPSVIDVYRLIYIVLLDYSYSITCFLYQGTYRPLCCPVSRFVHSPLRPVSLPKVDDRSVDREVFLLDRDLSSLNFVYAAAAPNTLASAFDLRSSRLTSGLSVSSVDLNQPIAHLAIAFRFVDFYFIYILYSLTLS